jgi:hypothetical protein
MTIDERKLAVVIAWAMVVTVVGLTASFSTVSEWMIFASAGMIPPAVVMQFWPAPQPIALPVRLVRR